MRQQLKYSRILLNLPIVSAIFTNVVAFVNHGMRAQLAIINCWCWPRICHWPSVDAIFHEHLRDVRACESKRIHSISYSLKCRFLCRPLLVLSRMLSLVVGGHGIFEEHAYL